MQNILNLLVRVINSHFSKPRKLNKIDTKKHLNVRAASLAYYACIYQIVLRHVVNSKVFTCSFSNGSRAPLLLANN